MLQINLFRKNSTLKPEIILYEIKFILQIIGGALLHFYFTFLIDVASGLFKEQLHLFTLIY